MSGKLPEGWRLEPEPDGTARLVIGDRPRRSRGVLLLLAGLGLCGFAVFVFARLQRGEASWRTLRLTLCLPLGVILAVQGLWEALGREEWRVGPDRLEVRQTLLGWRRVLRYRAAALKRVSGTSESGRWEALFVRAAGRTRCLRSSRGTPQRNEEVRALAELLSDHTGWPLVPPDKKRRGRRPGKRNSRRS